MTDDNQSLKEELIAHGAIRFFGDRGLQLPSREQWNSGSLWKYAFEGLADGPPFVAESFLGEQYRVVDGTVTRWNPETGEQEETGLDLHGWLALVRDDPSAEVPVWLLGGLGGRQWEAPA